MKRPNVFILLITVVFPFIAAAQDSKESLQGSIRIHTWYSPALQEERSLFVYLPPGYDSSKSYPVVLVMDSFCERLARVIEPLILADSIQPVIIASVGYKPMNSYDSVSLNYKIEYRNNEYLDIDHVFSGIPIPEGKMPEQAKDRYDKFTRYFETVIDSFLTEKYHFDTSNVNTIGGYSNGADFALTFTYSHRETFQNAIILSAGMARLPDSAYVDEISTCFYIASGAYEEGFNQKCKALAAYFGENDIPYKEKTYDHGHTVTMWKIAFEEYLMMIYR